MALAFINGMDDQVHSANTVGGWSGLFNSSVVRTGASSLSSTAANVGGSNIGLLPIPGGGDATVVMSCAIQSTTVAGTVGWFFLSDNGATLHVTVTLNMSTGVLTVYRGTNAGTVLGSVTLSGAAILANTWGFWEVKVILSDTVGRVTVRFNEAVVLDLTGQDTKNAGTKTVIDSIGYPLGTSASSNFTYVDDFYLVTGTGTPNDFLGDCKVQALYPSGDGSFSQLVGSDGDSTSNYLLVNEAGAPNTANYVESATVGQRDFYAMGDLPSSAVDVYGVQVTAYCNNPDAGSTRQVKVGVRQGTSEALSAAQATTAVTFLAERNVFATDPATGAAWTASGVNSVQAGMEVA